MTELARAHIIGQARLRAIISRAVAAAWAGLPGYDEVDVDPFVAQAVPLVLAGQRQSAALTEAFLARALGRRPVGLDLNEVVGAAARNGTPPEQVYRRPFVTVWTALNTGVQWEQAVASGLARAASTAEMDVQLASRATYGSVEAADNRIRGYRRVADADACTFCRQVNGAFVKSATAFALHNRCGCGLEPVLEPADASPLPDGVAVHEHGELGAVLTDPAHSFTHL